MPQSPLIKAFGLPRLEETLCTFYWLRIRKSSRQRLRIRKSQAGGFVQDDIQTQIKLIWASAASLSSPHSIRDPADTRLIGGTALWMKRFELQSQSQTLSTPQPFSCPSPTLNLHDIFRTDITVHLCEAHFVCIFECFWQCFDWQMVAVGGLHVVISVTIYSH